MNDRTQPRELDRERTIADLHELIDALDRRAPRAEPESERQVAGEAAALRQAARARLDTLGQPRVTAR